MKLINYSVTALLLFFFTSCTKELSLELADVNGAKAKKFQDFVVAKKFQLRAFYSDIPIDYIENDGKVKQETNLWAYVPAYLGDDSYIFKDNKTDLEVEQNAKKIHGNNDPVLYRKYSVVKEGDGVYMNFLDYQYNPLKYRLEKSGNDFFILSVKWTHGATLYSRFEVVP